MENQPCVRKFATANNVLPGQEQIEAIEPKHVVGAAGGMPQNHVCELIVDPLIGLPALVVERSLAVEEEVPVPMHDIVENRGEEVVGKIEEPLEFVLPHPDWSTPMLPKQVR